MPSGQLPPIIATNSAARPVHRLTKRREFLSVNRGIRVPMPAFVLIVEPRADADSSVGFGITATKKLGNAVVRNRVKRRFRAALQDVAASHGVAGADHVLIGRADALTLPYTQLSADLTKALTKAVRRLADRAGKAAAEKATTQKATTWETGAGKTRAGKTV